MGNIEPFSRPLTVINSEQMSKKEPQSLHKRGCGSEDIAVEYYFQGFS